VRLTQDGFATLFVDISGQLVSGQWVRVSLNASITNAQYGIKIDTNGDAVDVDFNQFEAGLQTSAMGTAGASRNGDQLSFAVAGNVNLTQGSAYAEMNSLVPNGLNNGYGTVIDLATNELLLDLGGQCYIVDGTANVNSTGGSAIVVGSTKKLASSWGSLTKSAVETGGVLASGTCVASLPSGGNMRIGMQGSVSIVGNMRPIRNIRIYSQKLTDAQLTAMVA
jgi:hypothetical protein